MYAYLAVFRPTFPPADPVDAASAIRTALEHAALPSDRLDHLRVLPHPERVAAALFLNAADSAAAGLAGLLLCLRATASARDVQDWTLSAWQPLTGPPPATERQEMVPPDR